MQQLLAPDQLLHRASSLLNSYLVIKIHNFQQVGLPPLQKKEDRQCAYNVTLRPVSETIFAVKKQKVFHISVSE
jgi:hypothetical protein